MDNDRMVIARGLVLVGNREPARCVFERPAATSSLAIADLVGATFGDPA